MNEELMMNDVAVEDNEIVNVDTCIDETNDRHKAGKIIIMVAVGTAAVYGIVEGGKKIIKGGKKLWNNIKSKKAEESEEILDAEVSED